MHRKALQGHRSAGRENDPPQFRRRGCQDYRSQRAETYPSIPKGKPHCDPNKNEATTRLASNLAADGSGRPFDMVKDDVLLAWQQSPHKDTLGFYGVGSPTHQPESVVFNQVVAACLVKVNGGGTQRRISKQAKKSSPRDMLAEKNHIPQTCNPFILNRQALQSDLQQIPHVQRQLDPRKACEVLYCTDSPQVTRDSTRVARHLYTGISRDQVFDMEPARRKDPRGLRRRHWYCPPDCIESRHGCTQHEWAKNKLDPHPLNKEFRNCPQEKEEHKGPEPINYDQLYSRILNCFEQKHCPDPLCEPYEKCCKPKRSHGKDNQGGGDSQIPRGDLGDPTGKKKSERGQEGKDKVTGVRDEGTVDKGDKEDKEDGKDKNRVDDRHKPKVTNKESDNDGNRNKDKEKYINNDTEDGINTEKKRDKEIVNENAKERDKKKDQEIEIGKERGRAKEKEKSQDKEKVKKNKKEKYKKREKKRGTENEKEWEWEREKEKENEKGRKNKREKEKEKENERKRKREMEMKKEREIKREQDKEKGKENEEKNKREKEKEKERKREREQREHEKEKDKEIEKEKQRDKEMIKEIDREIENKKRREKETGKEKEREKENDMKKEHKKEIEKEQKGKEQEKETEKEIEKGKEKEKERKREQENQKEKGKEVYKEQVIEKQKEREIGINKDKEKEVGKFPEKGNEKNKDEDIGYEKDDPDKYKNQNKQKDNIKISKDINTEVDKVLENKEENNKPKRNKPEESPRFSETERRKTQPEIPSEGERERPSKRGTTVEEYEFPALELGKNEPVAPTCKLKVPPKRKKKKIWEKNVCKDTPEKTCPPCPPAGCQCEICNFMDRPYNEQEAPFMREMRRAEQRRQLRAYYRQMCHQELIRDRRRTEYRAPKHQCDPICCSNFLCQNSRLAEHCDCLGAVQELQNLLAKDNEDHSRLLLRVENLRKRVCERMCDCILA
ncbi:myb-like protein X [Drosophila teissieri]|uniref:myb-like protein X n=1 Tax=Drosophila teissieri TaxID=7243 RepID=UPI001CB9F341|nr:myb-like protein X [Drosophila teissieri]